MDMMLFSGIINGGDKLLKVLFEGNSLAVFLPPPPPPSTFHLALLYFGGGSSRFVVAEARAFLSFLKNRFEDIFRHAMTSSSSKCLPADDVPCWGRNRKCQGLLIPRVLVSVSGGLELGL
ncbi:hypothetical protein CEXT_671841 [Caerostris extrusa]|uniref:Uncharacterized protein n=1 Tax=Caerostris extrusa TaxID=172846 RepID=A0AAV4V857_CAEEX|nr:hypothetical protein CEXT_671841 [Caerostris extrusa]